MPALAEYLGMTAEFPTGRLGAQGENLAVPLISTQFRGYPETSSLPVQRRAFSTSPWRRRTRAPWTITWSHSISIGGDRRATTPSCAPPGHGERVRRRAQAELGRLCTRTSPGPAPRPPSTRYAAPRTSARKSWSFRRSTRIRAPRPSSESTGSPTRRDGSTRRVSTRRPRTCAST